MEGENEDPIEWQDRLWNELPLLGHRNWILVVDKAFPLQSAPGIEVVYTNEDMDSVLTETLKYIGVQDHITPRVYRDYELDFISEELVPGVENYKSGLTDKLKEFQVETILHDSVFVKIDNASKLFKILVLKTNETIPYSSVFFELDCGYWNGEMEELLRRRIADAEQ